MVLRHMDCMLENQNQEGYKYQHELLLLRNKSNLANNKVKEEFLLKYSIIIQRLYHTSYVSKEQSSSYKELSSHALCLFDNKQSQAHPMFIFLKDLIFRSVKDEMTTSSNACNFINPKDVLVTMLYFEKEKSPLNNLFLLGAWYFKRNLHRFNLFEISQIACLYARLHHRQKQPEEAFPPQYFLLYEIYDMIQDMMIDSKSSFDVQVGERSEKGGKLLCNLLYSFQTHQIPVYNLVDISFKVLQDDHWKVWTENTYLKVYTIMRVLYDNGRLPYSFIEKYDSLLSTSIRHFSSNRLASICSMYSNIMKGYNKVPKVFNAIITRFYKMESNNWLQSIRSKDLLIIIKCFATIKQSTIDLHPILFKVMSRCHLSSIDDHLYVLNILRQYSPVNDISNMAVQSIIDDMYRVVLESPPHKEPSVTIKLLIYADTLAYPFHVNRDKLMDIGVKLSLKHGWRCVLPQYLLPLARHMVIKDSMTSETLIQIIDAGYIHFHRFSPSDLVHFTWYIGQCSHYAPIQASILMSRVASLLTSTPQSLQHFNAQSLWYLITTANKLLDSSTRLSFLSFVILNGSNWYSRYNTNYLPVLSLFHALDVSEISKLPSEVTEKLTSLLIDGVNEKRFSQEGLEILKNKLKIQMHEEAA